MKILRAVLLALLTSFAVGLVIGTWLRLRMEAPDVYFIGATPGAPADASGAAWTPGNVGLAGSVVLDPGHHEEQV